MTALATERVREGSSVETRPGTSTEQVSPAITAAMCRLVSADEFALFIVDPEGRSVSTVPGGPSGALGDPAFRAFLTAAADPVAGGGPHWFEDDDMATLAAVVGRRAGRTALVASGFRRPSAAARARAAKLMPDLVTMVGAYMDVNDRLRRVEMRHDAAMTALDQNECGVIAVAADGRPLFANAAADRFLAAGDGLGLRRGVVRPTDYAGAIRFRAALEEVADAVGNRDGRARAMAMLLPRQDGGRPAVLAIAPAKLRDRARSRGAAAILYILDACQSPVDALDAVCHLHGLSRVETELLKYLVGGLTLAEAAGEMRVKLETARAYLKQVFAKTGTHRQVDLIALMSRYGRALCGEFDFHPA